MTAVKEKLYKKALEGDANALTDLLEGEREGLYDFLLRMTGQISRSAESVDEVFQSLDEETLELYGTYPELRLCLYMTARKFNADIWNAETSRLMNQRLEGGPSEAKADADRQALAAIDRLLRSLGGREREPVVLRYISGFEPLQIAEVMGLPAAEVDALLATGLRRLASGGAKADVVVPLLTRMPRHELPPRSSQMTVNLSVVMQGIKTKPAGLWSPSRVMFLLVLIGGCAAWFFVPEVRRLSRFFERREPPKAVKIGEPPLPSKPGVPPRP